MNLKKLSKAEKNSLTIKDEILKKVKLKKAEIQDKEIK